MINNINLIVVITILLSASIYDIKYFRIPDFLTIGGSIYLLLSLIIFDKTNYLYFLLSGFGAFSLFYLVYFISKGKMGLGDAKLACFTGIFLGFKFWMVNIFFASFTALIFAFIMMKLKKYSINSKIPFGPFIAAGCMFAYFFKDIIF